MTLAQWVPRASLFLCVSMGCSRRSPPTLEAHVEASAVPPLASSAPVPEVVDFEEADFRGTFNGVKVVTTLEAKSRGVSGSCFYENVGTDIPLRGTLSDDGTLTMSELDGTRAVSTIVLRRGVDGSLAGTWSKGDRTGPAELTRIARAAGDPVLVVKRPSKERSLALCGDPFVDEKPKVPCWREASIPTVLGLSDRRFERSLNAALRKQSRMVVPANPEGIGVTVTYSVVFNARGILSIVSNGEFSCSSARKDCSVDSYVYGHNWGHSAGLTAAIDAAKIADSPSEFLDPAKARSASDEIFAEGYAYCIVGKEDDDGGLPEISSAVLVEAGVQIEYDNCGNHVHGDAWRVIPYGKVSAALKSDSPFSSAWKP